jgi:hypothetical protein
MTAVFAAAFHLGNLSLAPAQQADEAPALNERVIELYKAGRMTFRSRSGY